MTGRKFTLLVRGVVLLLLCAVSSGAQEQTEKEYCNARFGFCFSYPAHFEMDPPPENDDGRVLRDGDGCVVTAWGGYNVLEETLAEAMTSRSADFDTVTYRAKGKNWFVLSGYRGERHRLSQTLDGTRRGQRTGDGVPYGVEKGV